MIQFIEIEVNFSDFRESFCKSESSNMTKKIDVKINKSKFYFSNSDVNTNSDDKHGKPMHFNNRLDFSLAKN